MRGTRLTLFVGRLLYSLGLLRDGGLLEALRLQVPVLLHPVLLPGVVQLALEILLLLVLGGVLEESSNLCQFRSQFSLCLFVLEERHFFCKVISLFLDIIELKAVLFVNILSTSSVLLGRLH